MRFTKHAPNSAPSKGIFGEKLGWSLPRTSTPMHPVTSSCPTDSRFAPSR